MQFVALTSGCDQAMLFFLPLVLFFNVSLSIVSSICVRKETSSFGLFRCKLVSSVLGCQFQCIADESVAGLPGLSTADNTKGTRKSWVLFVWFVVLGGMFLLARLTCRWRKETSWMRTGRFAMVMMLSMTGNSSC